MFSLSGTVKSIKYVVFSSLSIMIRLVLLLRIILSIGTILSQYNFHSRAYLSVIMVNHKGFFQFTELYPYCYVCECKRWVIDKYRLSPTLCYLDLLLDYVFDIHSYWYDLILNVDIFLSIAVSVRKRGKFLVEKYFRSYVNSSWCLLLPNIYHYLF